MRKVALATGVELAVRQHGEGVAVLLLHAWGETHRVFDRLVPLLPDALSVVVPDQRGVGDSAKPAAGYALDDAAADVVALMDALELDACWLVGTSSGGYVAQLVAVEHPARVSGLVLVGSPSTLRGAAPAALVEAMSAWSDPVTRADLDVLQGALPLHGPVPASYVEDQMESALTIPSHVWRAVFEGLVAADPPIERGSIDVPTLILWGGAEDVLPADQGPALHEAIEGSRLVTYEGTGHLVLWEQPERIARDIAAFITAPPG